MTNQGKGMGKGLLVGIFTGAAVGSALALLFAPQSGKKLRGDIKTKSQDFTEDAEKYMLNAKKKASQFINDVKNSSELLISGVEKKVDAILKDSEKLLNDTKDKVENSVHIGKGKLKKKQARFKSAMKAGKKAYKMEKEE
jgi:gas vesicle protein